MKKKYFVKEVNEMEMIECPTCHGEKKIVGTLTSPALQEPVENTELSCPTCHGAGEITTGKQIHYAVGTVVVYGSAHVEDEGKEADYILGFVCDDESFIDKFKEQNNITSFIAYPNALSFYMNYEDTPLYDTFEEADAVRAEKEEGWKPELKLVDPEKQ